MRLVYCGKTIAIHLSIYLISACEKQILYKTFKISHPLYQLIKKTHPCIIMLPLLFSNKKAKNLSFLLH